MHFLFMEATLDAQQWQKALHEDDYLPPYSFPDDDLMRQLLNLYFEEDNDLICLIYRPTFERKVAQGLHEYDRAFGAVVLACCAIGSRYTNDPRVFLNANGHTAGWKYFRQIRPLPTSFTAPATLYDLQVYAVSPIDCLVLQLHEII